MIRHAVVLFLTFLAVSCQSDGTQVRLPASTGIVGEVVVKSSTKFVNGLYADSVSKMLSVPVEGLPQDESLFEVRLADEQAFGRIFRTFGNVLSFEIDENRFLKAESEISRNVRARQQVIYTIKAASEKEAFAFFRSEYENIVNLFVAADRNRLASKHKSAGSEKINKAIQNRFGFEIITPHGTRIATETDDILWLRIEREKTEKGYSHQVSQGLLIISRPYESEEQYTEYAMMNLLDSVLREQIPGPIDGSYMEIDDENLSVYSENVDFKGSYAKEMYGIWRVNGYPMGGPWYALNVVDEHQSKLFTFYGYVYAPQFKKRDYRREVEAVIWSVKFGD